MDKQSDANMFKVQRSLAAESLWTKLFLDHSPGIGDSLYCADSALAQPPSIPLICNAPLWRGCQTHIATEGRFCLPIHCIFHTRRHSDHAFVALARAFIAVHMSGLSGHTQMATKDRPGCKFGKNCVRVAFKFAWMPKDTAKDINYARWRQERQGRTAAWLDDLR